MLRPCLRQACYVTIGEVVEDGVNPGGDLAFAREGCRQGSCGERVEERHVAPVYEAREARGDRGRRVRGRDLGDGVKVGHEEGIEGGHELRGDAGLRGGGGAKKILDNVGYLLFDNVLAGGG